MRVDELHTEEDARMDALEDRARALEARVDEEKKARLKAEAERDAYKKAKAENDARFQRERDDARAERDAAVRAKEEVEADRATAVTFRAVLSPSPASGVVETSGEPFCACGRRWSDCDGSRSGCWAPGKDGTP